ncbi:hypothetical protein IE81DRAFT_213330 [Ceraceosorus guamensis]|uniref:Uncharacterized protein n=1 Tax=Ceraceosorus guamensis TaxID=1522189 RepID=A0A316W5V1_9BASI|nr:hypothetical protein IE81DRAFT_213330 [Ceraceosorus guamensis]PWN45340.1 hypothetical protein IE81DRAFT_213330 [Ceraceosorus guamensis]
MVNGRNVRRCEEHTVDSSFIPNNCYCAKHRACDGWMRAISTNAECDVPWQGVHGFEKLQTPKRSASRFLGYSSSYKLWQFRISCMAATQRPRRDQRETTGPRGRACTRAPAKYGIEPRRAALVDRRVVHARTSSAARNTAFVIWRTWAAVADACCC